MTLTRRQFTAAAGGIVIAFSMRGPGRRSSARAFPAAWRATAGSTPGCASTRTAPRPFSPARSNSAKASSPRWRRSLRKSCIAAGAHRNDFRRHRAHTGRRLHLRQPLDRGQRCRHPRCLRGSGEPAGRARRRAARLVVRRADRAGRRRLCAGHAQGELWRAGVASRPASRGDRQGSAQALWLAQNRRQAGAAPRHSRQGYRCARFCAGSAAARHAARTHRAAAALSRHSRSCRSARRKEIDRRGRGGARRFVPRRHRQA